MTRDVGPPTAAEIAAVTARLRHLRSPDATQAERAAFQADKHALLARIPAHDQPAIDPDQPAELAARPAELHGRIGDAAGARPGGWQTVSADEAAHQLTHRGYDPVTARGMVIDYLRDTSERVGAPAYAWGLDQGDIDALLADTRTAQPTQGHAGDSGAEHTEHADEAEWPR